ncbi:PDZ domain-containing protein [Pedobacter sp. Hv1]|uniref:PDZ domain-containing protein n=1 Tax=Pedobacter sp. Hv1 TaxID=1740090 RepID=UPI0006D8AEC3|nr:PDZ domain-containing protein [Pedobacter sp. Hv1]KQC00482.1 hypothetical protein AQF98_13490 [Pedobacter sp. Hv1]
MKKIILLTLVICLSYLNDCKSQTGGLGITFKIQESSKFPIITEVIKGSPAERCNIQANDFITKIDFVSAQNLSLEAVSNKLSGAIGTTCYITIWRNNKEYAISFIRADLNKLGNPSSSQYYSSVTYLNYKPKFGTITFDYPSTWEVGKNDNVKQAYNENYYLQPKGQEFEARSGQVVIRLFEPVSIMEDTKSLSATFSLALFNKFVTQISDGVQPNITTTLYAGKTYYECTQYNSGFVTKLIGTKSENGNLYVVAMAAAPKISTENNEILYKVAQSIRGAEPSLYLTSQEAVIRNWYNALGKGNKTEMEKLSCESANQINSLLSIAQQLYGSPNSSNLILSEAKKYDFSNLKFYTVGGNSTLVVIRICGNIIGPNGSIKSFYNYSNFLGGSNLYVVKLEQGQWKLCQAAGR